MRKFMRRFISTILVLVLIMNVNVGFASALIRKEFVGNQQVLILQEDEAVKVTLTEDENFKYRTEYNKKKNEIKFEILDKDTLKVLKTDKSIPPKLEKNNLNDVGFLKNGAVTSLRRVESINENTFINYEYTIYYSKPIKWNIRRPQANPINWYYYDTTETSVNRSDLYNFKNEVDKINAVEWKILAAIPTAILSTIYAIGTVQAALTSGGTLSQAAWTSIIASVSAGAAVVILCLDLQRYCKNAYDYFMRID